MIRTLEQDYIKAKEMLKMYCEDYGEESSMYKNQKTYVETLEREIKIKLNN